MFSADRVDGFTATLGATHDDSSGSLEVRIPVDDLPWYLASPAGLDPPAEARLRDVWLGIRRAATLLAENDGAGELSASTAPCLGILVGSSPRVSRRVDQSTTFLRMIEVPGTALPVRLRSWRRAVPGDGRIEVGRRLLLGPPEESGGAYEMTGRWRPSPLWRSLPVQLELWPHLDRWTVVTLVPRRRVHVTQWYYKRGHRLLEELERVLGASR